MKAFFSKRDKKHGPLSSTNVKIGSYEVKVGPKIGEGGFANVYFATADKQSFALKHILLSNVEGALEDARQEIQILQLLKGCPNVVGLKAHLITRSEAFLLIDLCEPTSLQEYIDSGRHRFLSCDDILHILLQIAVGVKWMHELTPPVIHRDLKAENILFGRGNSWIICDLGSATRGEKTYSDHADIYIEEEKVRKQTTPSYRPPEMWDLQAKQEIGRGVDIWALGIILYLLTFGKLPFDGLNSLAILNGQYNIPSRGASFEKIEILVSRMLQVDPRQRPSIQEVIAAIEPEQSFASDFILYSTEKDIVSGRNPTSEADSKLIEAWDPFQDDSSSAQDNDSYIDGIPASNVNWEENCKALEQILEVCV